MKTHTKNFGSIKNFLSLTVYQGGILAKGMIAIFFLTFLLVQESRGQAFAGSYAFTGTTATSGTIDPTAVPTATGVSFGSFSANGVSANSTAANRFSFTAWPTGATNLDNTTFTGSISATQYYQVTVTVSAGFTADLTSMTFDMTRSTTGTRHFSVRSDADGYTNNLAASTVASNLTVVSYGGQSNVLFWNLDATTGTFNSTITLSGGSFTGIPGGSSRTFRFYGWNAEGSGGTFSIDNVIFNGTATSATPPTIALSSPSQIAAGSILQGAIDYPISNFQADVTTSNAILNTLSFVTGNGGGSYSASDITNFKLYFNPTTNTFVNGSTIQIGTTQAGVGSGSTVTFGSPTVLNKTIPSGTSGYFWITATVANAAGAGNKFNVEASPTLGFLTGTPTGSIGAGGAQTITTAVPTIDLATPTTVSTADIAQNTFNNVLYRTDVTVGVTTAQLNTADFTTAGSYVAADLTALKLWYSTGSTFVSGSSTLIATLTTTNGLGAGTHTFNASSFAMPVGTQYLYVTADVPCTAVTGNNINVNAISLSSLSFVSGTPTNTGGFTTGGSRAIIDATPTNVTLSTATATATGLAGQVSLQWTNPPGCFNEVVIFAATAANTGTPTGDGSAYTPGGSNSPGTALGNGFVVYKGSTPPQIITGLTNETQYFFKIFTRNGNTWSSGTEITGTPVSTIYLNTFTGTLDCITVVNVPVMAANSTGAPLTRSTVTCTNITNAFNSTTLFTAASPSTVSYIQFSATAAPGYKLDLTSLSFFRQGSNTAPNQIEVAYSTDGFATSTTWGAAPLTPAAGTVAKWDFADFSTPTSGTVTFRIYPYGTTSVNLGSSVTTGTFRVDDVTINGTVSVVPSGPITLSPAHPTISSIGQGSVDNIIGAIELDNSAGTNAYLTGVTFITAGTYVATDVATNGFKVWLSLDPSDISAATQLGTSQPAVTSGGTVSVSGLSTLIPGGGAPRYLVVTATITPLAGVGNSLMLANTPHSNITIPGCTFVGSNPVAGGVPGTNDQFIYATTPTIDLANGTIPNGNIAQGTTNNVLYRVDMTVGVNGTTLNSAKFNTAGTYSASDISNLQLWYSTGLTFVAGSSTLLGTISSSLGTGSHTFSSLTQPIPVGTEYLYVTTDIPCAATLTNTINVAPVSTTSFTFSLGAVNGPLGGFTAGGDQQIVNGTPADVTGAGATGNGNSGEASVSWTNPPPCFDQVMIVAATASNTGVPANGTQYSVSTALGNGTVVYNGSSSPQVITGLTNGVTNYFKIYARYGSNWSAGVEVSTIPFYTASAGNVVVLQMGNGTETLAGTGNSIHLKQFATPGSPALSFTNVDLPTSGCTPLIAVGNSTAEGLMNLSADRDFIIVAGYVTTLTGAPTLSSSTGTVVNRGIGRVDASGNYTLATRSSTALTGQNFRSAVSDGANNFWGSGSGQGMNYFGNNGDRAVVCSAPIQNMRYLKLINGNLYFSSASGGTPNTSQPFGIFKLTGTPTTTGGVAVNLIPISTTTGTGASVSPYGFDISPDGNTCYVADDRAAASGGGIQKFTFNGSVWTWAYTLSAGGTVGARGLTVNFNGTFPVIYATSTESAPTPNRLFQITDLGTKIASDATIIDLSTAPTGTQYRGVAFAPIFDCANAISVSAPATANSCGPTGGQINISVTGGTAPYTYAWSNATGSVCNTTQNLSSIGAGTYTVSVSDAFGHCYGTASTTVTEFPLPTPVITGTPGFCPGYSTILDAGTSDVNGAYSSYVWSPTNTTDRSLSVNTAGPYSVSVTNVNGCVATSSVLNVTQFSPPSPTISGNSSVCAGGHIVLDAGPGYTSYAWSPGGAVTQTINVTASGTYTVTVSDANGCTGSTSKSITQGSISVSISGNLSYCIGSSTTLSVPSGFVSYLWSPGNQATNSISATAGSYSVTVFDGACTGTSPSVTVVENPLPTVSIAPASPATVCKNVPVSLTASGSTATYSWSPATGLNSITGATVSATPASTSSYTVAATDNNGCVNYASATVSIYQLPLVVITPPVSVLCSGGSTSLTASGATSYSWSPSTYLSNVNSSLVAVSLPAATITYTVTGTDGNNCTNTASSTVVVTPILPAPAVSSPVTYCQNAPAAALSAITNPSNATAIWYTTPTGSGGRSITPPVPSTSTAGTTSYYVSQSIGEGVQIAITGFVDNRTTDLFSFVALADIPAGTNIYFTDNGSTGGNTFRSYNSATAKSGTEDLVYFHAINQIPAGTVVQSYTVSANYNWVTGGGIGGGAGTNNNDYDTLLLSTAGDQITAFLSSNPNDPMNPASITRFLFVFDITNQFEFANSTSTGDIPFGLSISEGTAVTVLGALGPFPAPSGSYFSLINDGQYRSAGQWYQYITNTAHYFSILPADLTTGLPTASFNVAASCESPRSQIDVNVIDAPFPDASSNTPVCEGTSLNLQSDPLFLYTNYAWSGPGITPSNSADQNPVVANATVAASGIYSVTVTEQLSGNNCTATQAISVVVQPCGITLNMKMYIQGFYNVSTGFMDGDPLNYPNSGCLNILYQNALSANTDPEDVDTVNISLMDEFAYTLVETQRGILKRNGTITVNYTGPAVPGTNYWIQLKHRNLEETWSKAPVNFTSVTTYDFTTASTQAYDEGTLPMFEVVPGVWACFNGDIDQDGAVTSLDMTAEENDANLNAFGYYASDLDGDCGSTSLDMTIIENNANYGVFLADPLP